MFAPGLDAERQAVGPADPQPCPAGRGGRPVCRGIRAAAGGGGLLASRGPRRRRRRLALAEGSELQLFQAALGEGEKDDTVVGGDIDQAVSGEILQHAFAQAVVGGAAFRARGRAGRLRRTVCGRAVDGDNLRGTSMRLGESDGVLNAPTVYSETISRTWTRGVAGAEGDLADSRPETGGCHEGTLLEGLLGDGFG